MSGERGNMKTQLTLNTEDVPEIIRSGSWDKDKLQEGLGDSGTVIDLTGCSLENVLYEISAQRAVIAKTGADTSVVIVGYDAYNTWLLDPATAKSAPYGMNDSTALFQQAGNVFISYLDNQKNNFTGDRLMLSKGIAKFVQYGVESGTGFGV